MEESVGPISIYTRLYWLINDKKLDPRIFFDFLNFFWPKFSEIDDYIFLEQKYNKSEHAKIIKSKKNPEYWVNLLTLDSFFNSYDDGYEKSKLLTNAMIEIWKVKLQNEYPDKNFVIECVFDEEFGDCGLTFYQKKFGASAE